MKKYLVYIYHKWLDIAYYTTVIANDKNEASKIAKEKNKDFNVGGIKEA